MRALAVIDGEHYADVVRQALAELPYDVVAALFAGGTEKLRGGEDYGIPLAASLEEGVAEYLPGIVSNQAKTMLPATPQRTAESRLVAPAPSTAPEITWVVESGYPSFVAR